MYQRLVVATLGIAIFAGLAPLAQTSRRARRSSPVENQAARTPVPEEKKVQDPKQSKDNDTRKNSQKDADKAASSKPSKLEKATFGGGCFWCMEAVFERIPGVKSVVSGYAGGHVPNPTYEMVCTGLTGHAEVIQIEYDPAVVGFDKLLKFFWIAHDPTTLNSQGPDFGTQYRSIILYHDDDQKEAAQKQYKELMAHRLRKSPIVTELVPFDAFYAADAYHQDYYRNHPDADYSQIHIEPKLRKLSQKLK